VRVWAGVKGGVGGGGQGEKFNIVVVRSWCSEVGYSLRLQLSNGIHV
jgi:hypothetical protein